MGLGPHSPFYRWGSTALHPTALRYTLPADPALRLHLDAGMGWAANRTRATIRPIPWPDAVGHDPRVCVHPTVLPP